MIEGDENERRRRALFVHGGTHSGADSMQGELYLRVNRERLL